MVGITLIRQIRDEQEDEERRQQEELIITEQQRQYQQDTGDHTEGIANPAEVL